MTTLYFGDLYSRLICGKFTLRWYNKPEEPELATDKTDFKNLMPLFRLPVAQLLVINGALLVYVTD